METGTLTKEQERGMTAEQKAALEKAVKERSGRDGQEQGVERRV